VSRDEVAGREVPLTRIGKEWPLALVWSTAAFFVVFGEAWLDRSVPLWLGAIFFLWLFGAILAGAFGVVRHAEAVAHRLGEPYGTLVLTLSVTVIEVSFIAAVMIGGGSPTLARDTVLAVLMITLNGIAGLSLLLGGLKHREQNYNFESARSFLAVIIPLAVLALVLPNHTVTTPGPTLSTVQAVMTAGLTLLLYVCFLGIQTIRHAAYFADPVPAGRHRGVSAESLAPAHDEPDTLPLGLHIAFLVMLLLPIVFLAHEFSLFVERAVEAAGAPPDLVGLLIAILVLTPEGVGALRSALANELQRAVNIGLGSALATIGLTVPAVLIVALALGQQVELGIDPQEQVLLALTLAASLLTFSSGRTNILLGAVHLVLFLVYVVLIFDP
jgi:Ca2+:H+ antiporter